MTGAAETFRWTGGLMNEVALSNAEPVPLIDIDWEDPDQEFD